MVSTAGVIKKKKGANRVGTLTSFVTYQNSAKKTHKAYCHSTRYPEQERGVLCKDNRKGKSRKMFFVFMWPMQQH